MATHLTPVDDVEEARWFIDALSPEITVSGLVPPLFAAYARILHPAYAAGDERPIRWSEIAAQKGTTMHALASFAGVEGGRTAHRGYHDPREPDIATLDDKRLAILADLLALHTTTPDSVWLNVWDGFGGTPRSWRGHPRVVQEGGGRDYYLFTCALNQIVDVSAGFAQWPPEEDAEDDEGSFTITATYVGDGEPPEDPPRHPDAPERRIQSPQQWWPDDRTWAVATEIDDDYTVAAGSEELIAAILAHPGLEAFRVAAEDDLSGTSPL